MNSQQLIVVSGGSKGIGKAIIERFATEGFAIATFARNEQHLIDLETQIKKINPAVQVFTMVADAGQQKQVEAFATEVQKHFKQVDVLVNNAGIFKPGQILTEEPGTLEELFSVNVASAYHLSRALIPSMKQTGKGHVFNICSTASIIPYSNGGSYCISKFAMLGMSKVLREELKESGVKVTAVLPGATLTHSWSGTDLPETRFIKPQDVAEAVYAAYGLSPQAVVEELLIRPQLGDI